MTPTDNKALAEAVETLREIRRDYPNQTNADYADVAVAAIDTVIEALTREPSTPSAQVSGGGEALYTADEVDEAMEVLRGRNGSTALVGEVLDQMEATLRAALSAPQARSDGGESVLVSRVDLERVLRDGGPHDNMHQSEVDKYDEAKDHLWETMEAGNTHPTPAPDVARLVEAAKKLRQRQRAYLEQPKGQRDEAKGRLVGDAARELDQALAPFTAAQQEGSSHEG